MCVCIYKETAQRVCNFLSSDTFPGESCSSVLPVNRWLISALCIQVTGRRSTLTAGGAGSATRGKCCMSWTAVTMVVMMMRMETNMILIDLSCHLNLLLDLPNALNTNNMILHRPLCRWESAGKQQLEWLTAKPCLKMYFSKLECNRLCST